MSLLTSRISDASNHLVVQEYAPSPLQYSYDSNSIAVDFATPILLGRRSFNDPGRSSLSPSISSNFRVPVNAEDKNRSESRQTTRGEGVRSESHQSDKLRGHQSTPASRRSSVIGKPKSRSKAASESKSKSKAKLEIIRVEAAPETTRLVGNQRHGLPEWTARPTLPPFDRSVDLVAIADNIEDTTLFLEEPYPGDDVNQKFHIRRLPASVQRKIYGFCFPTEHRKISLSPWFATKAVFEMDFFASPWDVLEDVSGGLGAFTAIRKDLLSYFWATYHFHITLNAFTGPKFSPLSQFWLQDYLGTIQFLTMEVDFTRFGGDCLKIAADYGYNMKKEEMLLIDIIIGLSSREESTTMAELNLLCRRYAGYHPYQDPNFIKKFGTNPGKPSFNATLLYI
jgi:hypothetical protein